MAKKSNKLNKSNKSNKKVGKVGLFNWLNEPVKKPADVYENTQTSPVELTGLPPATTWNTWGNPPSQIEQELSKLTQEQALQQQGINVPNISQPGGMVLTEPQYQNLKGTDVAPTSSAPDRNQKLKNPFSGLKRNEAITLGLAGTDAFLRRNQAIQDNYNYQKRLRNVFTQKPIYDYNYLYGPDASGGTQYQSLIMAKDGAQIRKGTSPLTTDVEVEGGEFIQLPDKETQHVQGPSHAKGGVHTNLPEGTRVFSDYLKPNGSNKTYAQLAKKYDTNKFKKVLENPFSATSDRRTAELMFKRYESILNELFEDQQKKNGNSDGTDQASGFPDMEGMEENEVMGAEEMRHGGMHHGYLSSYMQDGGLSMGYDDPENLYRVYDPYNAYSNLNEFLPYNYGPEAVGKFGLDLREGEKLSFTNPFEYGGEYAGGYAEFQDGGMFPEDSTFYNNPTGDPSNLTIGTDVIKTSFQKGGTKTKETFVEDPNQTVAELEKKILANPRLQNAFITQYKKMFPKSPATVKDLLDALKTVTSNISEIRSKASEEELKDADLDKGTKNARYKELAKKYGVKALEDENAIKRFQAVYRTLAQLQGEKEFSPLLQEYELTPIGVDDTKWQGSLYSGKGISEADGWFGNTTIGQLVRKKQTEPATETPKEETKKETETPKGNEYPGFPPYEQTPSTMGRFPAYQAAPNVLGFLSGMTPYTYYTPDYTHFEVAPPTLNIDPELQSIDDTVAALSGQTTGNPSVDNARNTALFNQALQAKQQAFARKQNYDAEARFKADLYNVGERTKENYMDVNAAANVYNEYRAAAQDAAERERLSAIQNLTDKTAKFYQDEYAKMLAVSALMPGFYYEGTDLRNPLKINPKAREYYQSYWANRAGNKTPQTTETPGTTPSTSLPTAISTIAPMGPTGSIMPTTNPLAPRGPINVGNINVPTPGGIEINPLDLIVPGGPFEQRFYPQDYLTLPEVPSTKKKNTGSVR